MLFVPKLLCARFRNQREKDVGRSPLFRLFLEEKFAELVLRLRSAHHARRRSGAPVDAHVKNLVSQNRLGAAATALEENEVAPFSDELFAELKKKFPARKREFVIAEDEVRTVPDEVSVKDLQSVAAKVNKFSSAGPSGARMWFYTSPLRAASPTAVDNDFASNLCWLTNRVAAGAGWTRGLSQDVRLIAIRQPDGENGFKNRPIQIGECLDRFIGKVLLSKYMDDLKEFFGDTQSGVAPSGAERGVRLVQTALYKYSSGEVPYMMTFDFVNAFNEVSRAAIREQLVIHFPSLVPYFDLRYRHVSRVHFYNNVLLSWEGVRQ